MSFSHLHVHTTYSRFDGMSDIEELFKRAESLGQPGLAITDHGSTMGVREFFEKSRFHPSVKPVAGCEFYLTAGDHRDHSDKKAQRYHLILLAKNLTGYRNLSRLDYIARHEGFCVRPRIDHGLLERYHEGLVAMSACIGGEIPQAIIEEDDMDYARELTLWYRDLFGDDFFLEVSQHESRKPDYTGDLLQWQKKANEGIFTLGKELGIGVVATNDVHFVNKEDARAHDLMLCERTGNSIDDPNRFMYTGEEYLKSEAEMMEVFSGHPEVVGNTDDVLKKLYIYELS